MTMNELASAPQVDSKHYSFSRYVDASRWSSYWHQIDEVMSVNPRKVLVVGAGDNIVPLVLRTLGVEVSTYDLDPKLGADFVGDVRDIGMIVPSKSFDVVLCAQVLEHLPFESFQGAIASLLSVARNAIVISLPFRYVFLLSLSVKLPKISQLSLSVSVPRFWQTWTFDGEHYWEIGAKGYPKKRISDAIAAAGGAVKREFFAANYRYHFFYRVEPANTGPCEKC